MNLDTVLKHYVAAALWSSVDEYGEPLDAVYSMDDLSPETLLTMRKDVTSFVESNKNLLDDMGIAWGQSKADKDAQIGIDFWLTRNRHGAGFWDRGLGEIGDKLTNSAHDFGEVCLYVGDDGWLYC